MKFKHLPLILLLSILLIVSCKKTQPTPTNSVSVTSTNVFGGIFDFYNLQTFSASLGYYNEYAMQCALYNTNTPVNAGSVSVNNVALFCDTQSDNWYRDTAFTINYLQPNYTIIVGGNSVIPAFNYSFLPIKPSFLADSLIPTSFSKSMGFTINFGNSISNITDSVIVSLDGASKKMSPNQHSITFTGTDLALVSQGIGLTNIFKIELSHISKFTANNTDYYIRNLLSHSKYNIIVLP